MRLKSLAVTSNDERDFNTGLSQGPDAPEEFSERPDLFFADAKKDIAYTQPRSLGWSLAGKPRHDDAFSNLGGKEAEPRPSRAISPPQGEKVAKNRF